ncbi:MAG: hypothetical protein AAGL89_08690 [Pseudomonadota bacterium]
MQDQVQKLIDDVSDALSRSEFAKLQQFFAFPTSIFIEDKMILVLAPEHLALTLNEYRRGLDNLNVDHSRAELRHISKSREASVIAEVRCEFLDEEDQLITTCDVRYFLRMIGTELKIEMLEYDALPLRAEDRDSVLGLAI